MTFAALPLWGILAALGAVAAAIIALYLLRRTPRPQLVSNVQFWVQAVQRSRPRWLRATRIPLLSLLVSLCVGLLLVTEIGDPRFGDGVRGTTVVVLAAGQSMNATELGRSRMERALDELAGWVGRATASGQVAVVRAGIRPSILMPLTSDDADLTRALDGFAADEGPADLAGATRLADRIVAASGGNGQILVIADRAPDVVTRAPTVLIPVGAPADSLAISAFSARRDPIAVGEYAVHCQVSSFTSRRARGRLVIRDREITIFDQRFEIGPFDQLAFRAQGFSSEQGELVARIEEIEVAGGEDALATDDVAYAVAEPLEATRVLVVGQEPNRWLDTVLDAHGALTVTRAEPAALARMDASALSQQDVVILDRVAPPASFSHPGVLLIAPPDGALDMDLGGTLQSPRVTASLVSHPAIGGVRLESVRIRRSRAIEPRPADAVLARSGGNALMVARDSQGSRRVALGFDLGSTDLVERVAFPLLMHHAVRWLAGRSSSALLSRVPGEPLPVAEGTTVLDHDGEAASVEAGFVDATELAGIYHVGERAVAYSAAATAAALPAAAPRAAPSQASGLPPLAVLLAGLLLIIVTAEWWLLHRGRLS